MTKPAPIGVLKMRMRRPKRRRNAPSTLKPLIALHVQELHASPLVVLRQPTEIRHRLRTVEGPIPHLSRQDAGLHSELPAPLHRALRLPRPVEPAPADLEARHLRLRVHHQPLLVGVAVIARIGVRVGALARAAVGRAGGREDAAGGGG